MLKKKTKQKPLVTMFTEMVTRFIDPKKTQKHVDVKHFQTIICGKYMFNVFLFSTEHKFQLYVSS